MIYHSHSHTKKKCITRITSHALTNTNHQRQRVDNEVRVRVNPIIVIVTTN